MSDIGNKDVFAKNLAHYIETSGKTRGEICDELGIAYSTFSEWVNGRKYPRIDKIEMLANYFGVLKSQLIEADGNSAPAYPRNAVPAVRSEREPVQFWGKVSAGIGAYAEGVAVRTMPADEADMIDGYDYAWLQVEGDSMYPDLQDGDYVLVRVQSTASTGDLIVALIDSGDETDGVVKRLELVEGKHLALISINPSYPPRIFVGEDMNLVHIFGVVVSSKRRWA